MQLNRVLGAAWTAVWQRCDITHFLSWSQIKLTLIRWHSGNVLLGSFHTLLVHIFLKTAHLKKSGGGMSSMESWHGSQQYGNTPRTHCLGVVVEQSVVGWGSGAWHRREMKSRWSFWDRNRGFWQGDDVRYTQKTSGTIGSEICLIAWGEKRELNPKKVKNWSLL